VDDLWFNDRVEDVEEAGRMGYVAAAYDGEIDVQVKWDDGTEETVDRSLIKKIHT
jgi:hypothetical protein